MRNTQHLRETGSAPSIEPLAQGKFANTRWTLVRTAQADDSLAAHAALCELCRLYWYPLYAFVRRGGHAQHEAQDLTQEFFARLIARDYLGPADQSKGSFRTFLLTALKRFLANEWDKSRAQKRGGGQVPIQIDALLAEERYDREPSHSITPESLYERRWALTLVEETLGDLREEFAAGGKEEMFEALKGLLSGNARETPYAAVGEKLGMSEGAVKVAIYRFRQRYRDLLRARIAQTVETSREIDEEIRYLFKTLG